MDLKRYLLFGKYEYYRNMIILNATRHERMKVSIEQEYYIFYNYITKKNCTDTGLLLNYLLSK